MQHAPSDQQRGQPAAERTAAPGRASTFVDNRPEALAQRKLTAAINNSPRVIAQRQLAEAMHQSPRVTARRALSAALNHSPRVVAQRQQFAGMFGEPAQREAGLEDQGLSQGRFREPVQRADAEPDREPRENRTGLPDNLKSGIESLSGMSLDNVKVHYDSAQPAQLNALAYAQGSDIHVAPGQERHLPHEAWHVVQQAQGRVRPTMQLQDGVRVKDDVGLEHEANLMGAKALGPAAQRAAASSTATVVDNQPEVAQRELADTGHDSPRTQAQQASIRAVLSSPRVVAQARRLDGLFGAAQLRPNRANVAYRLHAGVEHLSGLDLSAVRVHYNSARPAGLGALAYTNGTDIEVGPGQGRHLPHEGWHVVQQLQGRVAPTVPAKDPSSDASGSVDMNDDAALEREADTMGARALQAGRSGNPGSRDDSGPTHNDRSSARRVRDGVVQRVKGGLEYTEDTPTMLYAYDPPFLASVNAHDKFSVGPVPMTSFRLGPGHDPTNATLGNFTNEDFDVLRSTPTVKLTNDVRSAEWVVERHKEDLPLDTMRKRMKADVDDMFTARNALAKEVTKRQSGWPGEVGIAFGSPGNTDGAGRVFIYSPGPAKGKAQITAKYTNEDTIRRINMLNASKFLTGTKVAPGEDIPRVTGTESQALRNADIGGTTSFSTADVLLNALVGNSNPIAATAGGGDRLTAAQVGLVKLMVINDALATTMVRYADTVGQAQEKNIQRFFPKSRRTEYVKTLADADLDDNELTELFNEIVRTSAADALLVYNSADAAALRTDEAFTELQDAIAHGAPDPGLAAMQVGKAQLTDPRMGVPAPSIVGGIKDAVLGANGALLRASIDWAADAYTELAGQESHYHTDPAGDVSTKVIVTSRGFTPVGADRGAIYEMRERELEIDRSGVFNIGSLSELYDAIDRIFGAAE